MAENTGADLAAATTFILATCAVAGAVAVALGRRLRRKHPPESAIADQATRSKR